MRAAISLSKTPTAGGQREFAADAADPASTAKDPPALPTNDTTSCARRPWTVPRRALPGRPARTRRPVPLRAARCLEPTACIPALRARNSPVASPAHRRQRPGAPPREMYLKLDAVARTSRPRLAAAPVAPMSALSSRRCCPDRRRPVRLVSACCCATAPLCVPCKRWAAAPMRIMAPRCVEAGHASTLCSSPGRCLADAELHPAYRRPSRASP